MFAHITLGTNDWTRTKPFHAAMMKVIQVNLFRETERGTAYGELTEPKVFLGPAYDGERAIFGNGTRVAFPAKTHAQVDVFYEVALAHGDKQQAVCRAREDAF